ncbi:MAG: hypothetical protein ACR2NH_11490 [Solirubrobacteraceae bacterium]
MRRCWCLTAATALTLLAGCGGSSGDPDPPVITDRSLSDSLAVAVNRSLDDAGIFGTRVGESGGRCREQAGGRWTCTLSIDLNDRIGDQRTYALRVDAKGCWTAVQTGTDIGGTDSIARPSDPARLRGCL